MQCCIDYNLTLQKYEHGAIVLNCTVFFLFEGELKCDFSRQEEGTC